MREAAGGAGNIDGPEGDQDDPQRDDPADRPAVGEPIGGVIGALAGGAVGTASVDPEAAEDDYGASADSDTAGDR